MEAAQNAADLRIRRTRQLLQEALEKLMETKDFDKISVQDIADAATVNRVTFYDHYTGKFALLECVVAPEAFGQRGRGELPRPRGVALRPAVNEQDRTARRVAALDRMQSGPPAAVQRVMPQPSLAEAAH